MGFRAQIWTKFTWINFFILTPAYNLDISADSEYSSYEQH